MKAVVAWWMAGTVLVAGAELKVATLHPLLADLAREVGGERVEVVDLTGPREDPHRFEPGSRELEQARGASLYLLCGKGLEPYLQKLRDVVGAGRVLEVGETLPSRTVRNLCAHTGEMHAHEGLDPHWWHSVDCWRRAARVVARRFGELDPEHGADYLARARAYRAELSELDRWIRAELARVPEERRILVTAHAAFGYFCHEYGWRMIAVQGLNREQVSSPKFVGEMARVMREERVTALFPEENSNPKMLKALADRLDLKVGAPLIASGEGKIAEMFRHNVRTIVAALRP